jgi:three-Cys-motif partner protein
MADSSFFDETTQPSLVKATIVEKYFDSWAGIIIGARKSRPDRGENRIGYVDLFAGPGRYKDGARSTCLRVLEKAIAKPEYAERLVTIFNDKDEENVRSLESAIKSLPGVGNLKYKPVIWHEEVGDKIAQDFARINTIPLLAFVDPWGYKGLTLNLVNAFLKGWGCDCIFFFNYLRINAGLGNPKVHEHMCALFGAQRAARLRVELGPLSPPERASRIINELSMALKQYGYRFVLPFGFKNDSGRRTTHHLILVTKHFKGYDVMKEIMAAASSETEQGVPSFSFVPASGLQQGLLFDLNQPLNELQQHLLADFAGQRLTMRQIYERHSVDRPFIARNYKEALCTLENAGKITAEPPAEKRRKETFADDVVVSFRK